MLQDILRCPELWKAISGSNCRGATDPKLDNLSLGNKQQLAHLAKLEEKGFEVSDLKQEIIDKARA